MIQYAVGWRYTLDPFAEKSVLAVANESFEFADNVREARGIERSFEIASCSSPVASCTSRGERGSDVVV